MADGQYKFSIGLDDKQLEMDIAQAKKAFDSLVKQARQAGAQIDDIPNPFEYIGRSAPKVAQATQQFNGLNMATQQLVRELPAASIGLNTFFLAISNNLPIFADQVRNLRQQGTSVAGVLKGIGTALFSWPTALVLGITALSMYGKEIGNWISSLFKGKSAVDSVKEATEGLNASIEKNGLGIGKELGKYESLRREFEAINGDLKEQERFVRDNQSAFDDLGVSVNSVVDAEAFFSGEGTEAFLTALRLRAEALAAQKLAVEQYEKALIAEAEAAKLPEKIITSTSPIYSRTRTGVVTTGYKINTTYNPERKELESEAEAARNVADAYFDIHDAKMQAASDTLEGANIKQSDEQAQAQIRAAELRAKQIADASARLMTDAQRATTQAEVDAMAEGIQKKIAQINLNYDIEEQAITKREEELKKLRGGMLTAQEKESFASLRSSNAAERDRKIAAASADALRATEEAQKAEIASWNDYLIEYGSFKEKILATTEKYNRLIADAENEGERMSLGAERDALLAEYEVRASEWAQELVDKTAEQITAMASNLQNVLDSLQADYNALGSSDSDEAKNLLAVINTLKAQIKVLKEQTGEASKAVSDDNWAEAAHVFQNIASTAQEAAGGIAEYNEEAGMALSGIAQLASLSIDLIGGLQGVQKAFKATGEAASAMEKASAILAVIGVAIKAISGIFNIMKSNEEATRNATLAAYEYAQALKEIANTDLRESFSTMFGKDSYGEFSALLGETQKQLQELEDTKKKLAKSEDGAVSSLGIEGNFGSLRDKMNEARSLDTALVADMRSGWQKFWGTGSYNIKATSLEEFYEDGKLNVDKLKAYYDTYKDYLNEEQADLVKSLIDTGELYEQNMEAINGYMRDIFGDLGASITDSLVDAFKNGTDAAEAMGKAVSDVMEQIATDMAHAAFIQPLLDQAQAGIEALNAERRASGMSDEEYMRRLMDITSTLMGNAQDAGEDMSAYLDTMRQMADEMGIDLFESDNAKNTTYAKGFQTMSQETGSELNGRFTDIQGQTHRIAEAVEFIKGLQGQHTQHLQSVSSTLASIHNDTSLIAQHTKALGEIRDDISVMRRAMDNGII